MHHIPSMRMLSLVGLMFVGTKLAALSSVHAAAAAWHQEELIKASDAIAVIEIYERKLSVASGSVLQKNGQEFSTALIAYTSRVVTPIFGRLPREPFIIQFDGAGDRSPLEIGRYILFLRAEGHLFAPLESGFKITGGNVFWYKKPFLRGDNGPYFDQVPVGDVIREIKQLLKRYKG